MSNTVSFADLMGDPSQYIFNPALIQQRVIEALSRGLNGEIDIVDPNNPFIFCLGASACNTAAFVDWNQAATRQQYPIVAASMADLYRHMSDKDYIDRFAKPVTARFTFILAKNEVRNAMVLDRDTNINKLRLPRNMVVRAGEVPFSLQYPVEIRELIHDGLQVVYLTDKTTPLQTLSTNIIDWKLITDSAGVEYISFDLELSQFQIVSTYMDLGASSGFKTTMQFPDEFYYARVWRQNPTDYTWSEILTTHSRQVYDFTTPTALLTVREGELDVVIPPVYINADLIDGKVRVDCYVSRGAMDLRLESVSTGDYEVEWLNVDPSDDDVYTAPTRSLANVLVYSTAYARGGRSALTLEELKARMISNSIGTQHLPVTPQQTRTTLEDAGFSLTRSVDNVTSRMLWASRAMPKSSDEKILTAASATLATVKMVLGEASSIYGAYDNGIRVSLTSSCLYRQSAGITRPLTVQQYSNLRSMAAQDLSDTLSEIQHYYSPFTYVLDASTDTFEMRAYYMDAPAVSARSFVEDNPTTLYQVGSGSLMSLSRNATGYELTILTKSNDEFRQLEDTEIFAQLSFKSQGQDTPLYVMGSIVMEPKERERYITFKIETRQDIDALHQLYLTGDMGTNEGEARPVNLTQWFDVVYFTRAKVGSAWSPITADTMIYQKKVGDTYRAICHERILLRFGAHLPNLWSMSRSVTDTIPYKTYASTVYYVHEENVYETNEKGLKFDVVDGKVVYRTKYAKGSYILDPDTGVPLVRYAKGDVMLDRNGNPVPEDDWVVRMVRLLDMFMIDGVYYFATDAVVRKYRSDMLDVLIGWITGDVAEFQKNLLERTTIYYTPKTSIGQITVTSDKNRDIIIPAQQSLTLTLVVPPRTYNDEVLREQLRRATIRTIDAQLTKTTVTISGIEYALRDVYGTDVLDVKLEGLGRSGGVDQQVLTLTSDAMSCSIKKKLTKLADGSLVVMEDITIIFLKHGVDA